MTHQQFCAECKTRLVPVHASDLSEEAKRHRDAAAVNILNQFTFHICPRCGFTTLYADAKARKVAEDLLIDQGGHG